ncbi:MAG TPA: methyltransferase domain-containing protein [Caulobacteraceae bacterium]|nr:methyltransferase domain-containing protein [Caulobacteraceae bacterium]
MARAPLGFDSPHARRYYPRMLPNLDAKLGSRRSAEAVVPLIVELIRPASVVDVGCGVGSWLVAFGAAGVGDTLGIDGPHLDTGLLKIPRETFLAADLDQDLDLGRRFDLALCLEAAGYLLPERAEPLVEMLTRAAPAVVFSSAVPFQDDPRVQVNQQWPGYWAERFAARGFAAIDCLRPAIWNDNRVSWWFRQNMVLYVDRSKLGAYDVLRDRPECHAGPPLPLVHPEHYLAVQARARRGLAVSALEALQDGLRAAVPEPVLARLRKLRG